MNKGIVTVYKKIRFRSRLEAKWARFFDLCNWNWEYEPCDFKGWIPDFALYGKNDLVYVEVKPVIVFPKDISLEIEKSGCDSEVLIVGQANPLPDIADNDKCCDYPWANATYIGWLAERADPLDEYCWAWGSAMYQKCETAELHLGFCHAVMSYHDRITGGYDGGNVNNPPYNEIQSLWAEASNKVQWRAR